VHPGRGRALRLQHRAPLMRAMFVVYLVAIWVGLAALLLLALRHV
jgi:hypothetical protein